MNEQGTVPRTLGSRALTHIFNVIVSVGILIMMLHVLANVFMRYLFNSPLSGTHEVVAYWYMPIVAFLGFVLAKAANQNIEAPLIFDKLTWGNRRILVLSASVVGVVMCALLAYFTFTGHALHGLDVRTTGGVSSVQIWPVFFLPPLVFGILLAMFWQDGVRALRGQIGDQGGQDEVAFGDTAEELQDLAEQEVESKK